jgi:ferric hydroxamate transport system ATP-binding protein
MLDLTDIEMRHGARTVLSVPELSLSGSAFTAIIGHNGSGKSTLMSLMARQQKPTSGRLILDGADLHGISQRDLARRLAFLPQQLADVPGLDVREDALVATDLTSYASRMVDQLSGGERQRAWIAMLIAQQSPLLLLDEPTSALDLVHQYGVMSLLRGLNRSAGRGVVVVLHDVNLAARFSDRVIALKDGRIAFDGPPAELMSGGLLSDLYGIDIRLLPHPDDAHPIAIVA